MSEIRFSRPSLNSLKKAYKKAAENGDDAFVWLDETDGREHPLLTSYAKYMIEFLETKIS